MGAPHDSPLPPAYARHFPLPWAHLPSVAAGKTSANLLWTMTLPWAPVAGTPHFWVCVGGGRGGGLKSQTWIDCYRLVATMEKDRRCTPARLGGNRDRMQRCKESEPSRAGLPTQQRKGKLLPGKAIWGRRLQGQAPRKLCQERKKLADGKHRLKKKKNPRGSEQGNG